MLSMSDSKLFIYSQLLYLLNEKQHSKSICEGNLSLRGHINKNNVHQIINLCDLFEMITTVFKTEMPKPGSAGQS